MDLSQAPLSRRALLAGAVALAASGCTRGPEPTGGPAPVRAPAGALRLPIGDLPTQWNPWHANGDTADVRAILAPLRTPAFTFDVSGTARANPLVLTSAIAGGTPTVATLRLNPSAVWADGAPVTAADWVATWQAIGGQDKRYNASAMPGWDRIGEVRAGADDHEVIVTYTTTDPDWTQPLADMPARAASVGDPETFNRGWSTYRLEWQAGPFVLKYLDRLQGVVTLQPNPRWWGARPRLQTVVLRSVPSDAVAAAFAAGEFDLYSPPDAGLLQLARTASDSSTRTARGTAGSVLILATDGTLGDARLRRVVVRGLDRARIARAALAQFDPDPTVWNHHLLLPQQTGYVNIAEATGLTYDVTSAGQSLTDLGWPLVDGRRRGADGPLTLTFTTPPGDRVAAAVADAVDADLGRLGIDLTRVASAGDLTVAHVPVGRYPLVGLTRRFTDVPGAPGLAADIATATDAAARSGLVDRVARLLWQDARTLPLFAVPDVAAVRTRLTGLGAPGLSSVAWEGVGLSD